MLEFTGTLTKIGNAETFGSKGFQKRQIIVKEGSDSKWPNIVPFTLKKDRCSLVDGISVNSKVKVHFVLEGRTWDDPKSGQTKHFCDNVVLKIDILEGGSTAKPVPPPATPTEDIGGEDIDDMPF